MYKLTILLESGAKITVQTEDYVELITIYNLFEFQMKDYKVTKKEKNNVRLQENLCSYC